MLELLRQAEILERAITQAMETAQNDVPTAIALLMIAEHANRGWNHDSLWWQTVITLWQNRPTDRA